MNQRYEQLLAQARIVPNPPGTYRRYDNILPEQMGKFAELIVQECIDIIAPYTVRMSKPGEEYLHPILEIKQHFGVEE